MKKYVLASITMTVGRHLINGTGAAKATTIAFKASRKGSAKFSIGVKSSGTTPRYSLYILASMDGINFVAPDDMAAALITVTDNNRHVKAVSPTLAPFYKIQIDGDGSNGADTYIDELDIVVVDN